MKTKYTITLTIESWNNHEIDLGLLLDQAEDAAEYLQMGVSPLGGDVVIAGRNGPLVAVINKQQSTTIGE